MPFDLAVIDLDNTLYAADSGLFARMDKRMTAFVASELNVDETERILITLGIAHHFERNNGAGTDTVDVIGEAFIAQ